MPAATGHDALRTELAVLAATALARSGDHAAAISVLTDADAGGPAALDLLARSHAQTGGLDEADVCWARVQATEPDHAGAAAGRATIEAIRSGRRRPRPALRPVRVTAVGVAVVAAVVAGVALTPGHPSVRPPDAAVVRAERQAKDATRRADALRHQVAATAAGQRAAADRRTAALTAIAARLAQPGVTVRIAAGAVTVSFPDRVFSTADRLTSAGRRGLSRLGARLSGVDGSIVVTGWSVPVRGGPTHGGTVVALDRAVVAAAVLADASGLPLTRFDVASGDQGTPPFPDAARNRTVTVTITPAE
jgi:hypothetical protein